MHESEIFERPELSSISTDQQAPLMMAQLTSELASQQTMILWPHSLPINTHSESHDSLLVSYLKELILERTISEQKMNWRATAGHKVSVADSDSDDWDTEADYENKVAEKDLKSAARTHGEKVFCVLSKPNY